MAKKNNFPPRFNNAFLNTLAQSFIKRRRAIKHQGNLDINFDTANNTIIINFSGIYSRKITLKARPNKNTISIEVRNSKYNHEKLIFRLSEMSVVSNGPKVVRAFEDSITIIGIDLEEEGVEAAYKELIRVWRQVSLEPIPHGCVS